MTQRNCTTCLAEEPECGFRNGLTCAACEADYQRDYVIRNKARIAEYKKQWAKNNRSAVVAATKAYRERKKGTTNGG